MWEIDQEKLQAQFKERSTVFEAEEATLDMWGGEEACEQLADLLSEAIDSEHGSIRPPRIKGEMIEVVIYPDNDGFIMGVRPYMFPDWCPNGAQVASLWQETDNYLPRQEDSATGEFDTSEKGMTKALTDLVAEANRLFEVLQRLAY